MRSSAAYSRELIYVSSLILIAIHIAFASDLYDYEYISDDLENDLNLPTNKRYAMLSYNYGRSRNRYGSWKGRDGGKRHRYNKMWRPWERLPDTQCFRKRCNSSKDCCRRYNICDSYAHVCYDCWYGFPCKTSNDCCKRFPYCNPRRNICTS